MSVSDTAGKDEPPLISSLTTISQKIAVTGDWVVSVSEALHSVGAAEAAWKPAPDERSIWEIAGHMHAWTEWAVQFIQGKDIDVTDWPTPNTDGGEAAWEAMRTTLQSSLDTLTERIAALSAGDLWLAPTPEVTKTHRFIGISSILVHNAYHAGQITKLRERYKATLAHA